MSINDPKFRAILKRFDAMTLRHERAAANAAGTWNYVGAAHSYGMFRTLRTIRLFECSAQVRVRFAAHEARIAMAQESKASRFLSTQQAIERLLEVA